MDSVFKDVGGTLQRVAKIDFVLGILCIIICTIIEIAVGFETLGIVFGSGLVAGGSLIGLAYVLYAFGQITNDVHRLGQASLPDRPEADEIPEI